MMNVGATFIWALPSQAIEQTFNYKRLLNAERQWWHMALCTSTGDVELP